MSNWKMKAKDFYQILNEEQNGRCSYTGWELTPENTRIAHKVPLKYGGKHEYDNVELIHSSIANLARDLPRDEVIQLCKTVVNNLEKSNANKI